MKQKEEMKMKLTENRLKRLIESIIFQRLGCSSNAYGVEAANSHRIDLDAIAFHFDFTEEERMKLIGEMTNDHWRDK